MMGLSSAKEGHRPSVHSRFHSARVTNTAFRQSRSSVDFRCTEPALQAARQRGQEPPQDQSAAPVRIRSASGSPGMRSGAQRGLLQIADDMQRRPYPARPLPVPEAVRNAHRMPLR